MSRPYNNLGTCYAQIGHYDIAYNNFKKAYQIKNPNNLTSLAVYAYNIGKYLLEIKLEYENALKFFEKSILIDLNFRPAVHSKAVCLIKKGKLVEAKKLIEKALLKWPKDAKLNNNYAFVLLKNGNYHHALKRSLYTLQLDPGQYTALAIAAVAEKERKNYNKSILYWEKYLQQASNNIYAICALIELYTIKQQPVKVYKQVVSLLELKGLKNWDAFWTTVLVDKKFDSYPLNTNKTQTIVKETLNKLFIMD